MKTFLIISSEKGKTKTVKITAENSEIAINSFKNGRPGVSVTAIYEARESDFLRYATGENLGQFVRIKQQPQDLKITVNTPKNPYITGYGKKSANNARHKKPHGPLVARLLSDFF